jgi:hypothetical protein
LAAAQYLVNGRGLASIRGLKHKLRKSLIFNPRFTQVVDFHDIFRYFQVFAMDFAEG